MQEQHKPFPILFQEHLKAGTRASQSADDPRHQKWKHEEFASAVRCEARTVTNWKNGSRTPLSEERDRIVALLFGDNPLHAAAKAAFIAAWQVADGRRGLPGRRAQSPATPRRGGQSAADWVPEQPFVLRDGLGRLYVHQSQNETPGSAVDLGVTAEAGRVDLRVPATTDTPRVDDTFVVSKAEIVVVKDLNVTPVSCTTRGADIRHPSVQFVGSWHLKVPVADDGFAGGIVLAGDILRQYATRDGLPYGVRIELRCRDIDLKPIEHPPPPEISEKQRAVLRRVLQRQDADPGSGVIVLAGAELYRPADP